MFYHKLIYIVVGKTFVISTIEIKSLYKVQNMQAPSTEIIPWDSILYIQNQQP
jgi:hypothetical protein